MMKLVSLCIFIIFLCPLFGQVGVAISDSIIINNVTSSLTPHVDTAVSAPIVINTLIRHFVISDSIVINTMTEDYTDYRIRTIAQAPNPAILEIPEGGYGYAWFIAEGWGGGRWQPLANANIQAEDAQGNIITSMIKKLPYRFLTQPLFINNAGAFAVSIPHSMIGNGSPGSVDTITVVRANGLDIAENNRQSITCRIVPYEYTASWGYRLYAKGGAGVTAGVVTATGFAGGGSGASITLDLQGLDHNPEWSALRISRRDDIFVGASVQLGPPRIINIYEAGATAQATFPYETEYAFDYNNMTPLEALMAYYLFAEPSILYTVGRNPVGQISVGFLSCVVQVLIANNAHNGLGIARLSDETGLDIEGNINFSTDLLEGLPIGLSIGSGLGASAHLGGSKKVYTNGYLQRRMYLGGQLNASAGLGPKIVSSPGNAFPTFYPQGLKQMQMNFNMGVDYQILGTWHNNNWRSVQLSSALSSNLSHLNIYNFPGQVQQYSAYLNVDNTAMRNILLNTSQSVNNMWNIGTSAVSFSANNRTFSNDFEGFLRTVEIEQNRNLPVQLKYGFACEDKSSFNIDLDMELPLPPPLSFLVAKLGGGIQATDFRNYDLANGYWVKGYPYLQTEMPNPPQPAVSFSDLINGIWDKLTQGATFQELVATVTQNIRQRFFGWLGLRTEQIEVLNDYGSTLTITENSIPAEVDSVYFRYWEWGEEPEDPRLTRRQRELIRDYNLNLRNTREDALGMIYGIGGFFKFEAEAEEWNESPLLRIVYRDEEVEEINENTLAVYWEDSTGNWNHLLSRVEPDSNFVETNIPYFTTYTLAPTMPQGGFGMSAEPDSLIADGLSTAIVSSETLYNNDGSIVSDGTLYTITLNRGRIITPDANPADSVNVQIAVSDGILSFEIESDEIAFPITIRAKSVVGISQSELEIPLYTVDPPEPITLLAVQPEHRALRVSWEESDAPGVVGYRIHYNSSASGEPYNGTANVSGFNSPVNVGKINQFTLTGLNNDDEYYIVITAFDAYGLESEFSNELSAHPVLQAVHDLEIEKTEQGVLLNWQPSFGATAYKIYRSDRINIPLAEMQIVGETTELYWLDNETFEKIFYIIVSIGY